MSREFGEGFEITFSNGSKARVSLKDKPRLRGSTTAFLWCPGEHYSELGEEGAVWALQQGAVNAAAVTIRLLPIPQKYDF